MFAFSSRPITTRKIGKISRNEYFTVENREGFARPSRVPQTVAADSPAR